MRLFLLLGSLNMALSIALGAFGAHGLKGKVAEKMIANWNTGAHYHMIHALGMLIVGILLSKVQDSGMLTTSGWLMLVGVVLFSGSLYVMAVTGVTKLGAITPIGGLAFIMAWILMAAVAYKQFS
ncbi:Uncharacterized membrane protein YgdD, TMEM256/DUF423 family [Thermoactinomyces sp. DSM 45891]|uniref:DUF423 domain-containing protein n=1 Tax=Thermoactinomyces sp. DSM 45891 TaxID=1761907 RepID=UPI00092317F7|nr:DUF423 domain-containing protein [Thermoactinomyces sp. DSM 45891]SFX46075.1 Uncharacterized membrane protein YgdD, TMEM256/DUF423 family [Thermoactinomyces sp. DSM 45891]